MAEPLPKWHTHDVESLRHFSRIRLIAVDLDGTLLDSSTSRLYQPIQKLSSTLRRYYQVALTLATGRSLAGASPLLEGLSPQKGMPLILYNGSVVVRNERFGLIYQRTIPSEALQTILEISRDYAVRTFVYVYNDPTSRFFRLQDALEYVLGWSESERPECEFNGMPVQWQNTYIVDDILEPSAILVDTSGDPKVAQAIEAELGGVSDISFTRSGSSYIEVRPIGSNKGVALECVARFLGLSREELLALGDNDNDAEMLAWAGIGVSIANASSAAVRSSDYVCQYGVAQGAIELLRLVKDARRYFFDRKKGKARA